MADYSQGENLADAGELAAMLRAIYECPQPTIARVQGDVYAGGMGLVAACDMAVSVDTANYCLSEVKDTGHHQPLCDPCHGRACGAPLLFDR
ncbi:MAG: 1,4-Dihydroxy-2-naphthoyl-CoA synthase [Pseudomonadota bacterium]